MAILSGDHDEMSRSELLDTAGLLAALAEEV